jgi:hypothetical protein
MQLLFAALSNTRVTLCKDAVLHIILAINDVNDDHACQPSGSGSKATIVYVLFTVFSSAQWICKPEMQTSSQRKVCKSMQDNAMTSTCMQDNAAVLMHCCCGITH